MKTLALILALLLQTTGLWSHLPAAQRAQLADQATTQPATAVTRAVATTAPLALPIRTTSEPLQFDTSSSILAIDRTTATPLFGQNENQKRPIASVTKLITAVVILSKHQPDELVKIPTLPTYGPDDDIIGLVAEETYRLGDLVKAALIPSANDAADALAIFDSGSINGFASTMNAKMAEWNITDTRFSNPSGLQNNDNYASAQALGKIALLSLENSFIRDTVNQTSIRFTSTAGRSLSRDSTNDLLSTGKFYGIKTGYTLLAGQCFVGLTRVHGHDVITVVLGSTDRFGDTQLLTNWIGRTYQWL